jgi:hypothetical protein|tara:strand:- start:5434 stop:5775 length:342 start_codon:yes stop_codon:yes gene_type:complete
MSDLDRIIQLSRHGTNNAQRPAPEVSEEEVTVDNAGNIEGYLNTIDEYVEQVFQIDDQSRPEDIREMAYRIQNAVDDIRTRELGLTPSNIRAQYSETASTEESVEINKEKGNE